MKIRYLCIALVVSTLACASSTFAQYATELAPVLSRLQSLSHGVYTKAEWDQAMQELDAVDQKAADAGDLELVVQSRAIKAMAIADMKRDPREALRVLDETRKQYGGQKIPAMRRVFVQQADYYGRLGDAAGVQRVMEEFRKNPNYDATQYPVELYEGRDTPMLITRPFAAGSDSISVTSMEVARERTQFAPGNLFPDLAWTDASGASGSIESLRGKVVLVDFWQQAWTPWSRDLNNLRGTYARYHDLGFEVVGVALDRDAEAARAFAQQQQMAWPLVLGQPELARRLRLFGEASNFLVDQNGVIVARNVRGADLPALLQRLLSIR
ncbi:MAG: TlpA family protein disulfide reductase [Kiritimatiellae bacterium]|nr:TlpA family protein disulfide reductase [Kiritimatiellia bacterium]